MGRHQLTQQMPELPEVEVYRRYFETHALGQKIRSVTVRDRGVLSPGVSPEALNRALKGRQFESVERHGKNLFARISTDGYLRVHFGMTGDLRYFRGSEESPRFSRVILNFDNGSHLAYEDARKFGRIELLENAAEYLEAKRFGPDPLSPEFNVAAFARVLAKRRGAMKPALMNQKIIAGVGNLYADEALFHAGIHPLASIEKIGIAGVTRVMTTLRRILMKVLEVQARDKPYPRSYLLPRREEGEVCPRCGGRIARATVGGRTTYFCSRHQRR